jgi:hypothetical protein
MNARGALRSGGQKCRKCGRPAVVAHFTREIVADATTRIHDHVTRTLAMHDARAIARSLQQTLVLLEGLRGVADAECIDCLTQLEAFPT